jgi:hypothetical protein
MKQRLRILILGPYAPKYASRKLETLQKCLIDKGFSQTRLVKDFSDTVIYSQDPDEHFVLKSQKIIREWAHVPIFVFLKDVDNQGVTVELTYTCLTLMDKQSCCATFFEGRWENFSSLIRGQVKLTKRVSHMDFENEKELWELATGHALKMLDRLYYFLG